MNVKKWYKNLQTTIFSLSLHPQLRNIVDDSVAQLVEHNTFNVGVLGSNPSWITKGNRHLKEKSGKSLLNPVFRRLFLFSEFHLIDRKMTF